MTNDKSFNRVAAISSIVAALLILAATIVLSMAVDFNFEFLDSPASLLTAGLDANAAELFRWGSVLELLGYFLFLIPVTVYLWYRLKPYNPNLVALATVCGLGNIFIGVIGAAIRASIWPSIMNAYPQAAEVQRAVLDVVFRSITDFTFEGLYATDSILGGLWWLGIGLTLRHDRRVLGITTAIMGIAILGAGFGWLLGIDPLARLEMIYFFEPVWLVWLGFVIFQHARESQPDLHPATVA